MSFCPFTFCCFAFQPVFHFDDCSFTNDAAVIRKNPVQVALNTAFEMDLSGQCSQDSIGTYMMTGVGSQLDFLRGAALSVRGLPIIAMPSMNEKGESNIVNTLKQGAGMCHCHLEESKQHRARILSSRSS